MNQLHVDIFLLQSTLVDNFTATPVLHDITETPGKSCFDQVG